MLDRYGNVVTTSSRPAFDAYCEGVDLYLAAQAGALETLARACNLDPQFALAHAALARGLQSSARVKEARAHLALALEHADKLDRNKSAQEIDHISIVNLLLTGKSAKAFERIKTHTRSYPRDVMLVQPCCGVFGLIGFSGRTGREQENLDFMAALHRHYDGDWWFESQFAFAMCETGQLAQAESKNEAAFALNPNNANAVHHRAHIHYETGEFVLGRHALSDWRSGYSRDGILHCHLAWHDALWALAAEDPARLWEIVESDVLPGVASAPPINVMTDLVAILLRAELGGITPPARFWPIVSDYAQECFPRPGISFADAHSVIAYATTREEEAIQGLQDSPRGWAGDLVASLALAFTAFAEQSWQRCLDELEPVMVGHERLGGSRAQRDLFELTYAYAQRKLGGHPESLRVQPFLGA